MTRAEAIRWLEDIHHRFNPTGENLENEGGDVHLQALDMAIEALKVTQESTQDLISRAEAIEAVARALWHYPNECYKNLNTYEVAEALVVDAIKSLPQSAPVVFADPIIDEKTIYCSPKIARDVEVVVRCKDCKWAEKAILDEYCVECTMYHTSSMRHGYCHHGERREEDDK